jgi:hypothetical protein
VTVWVPQLRPLVRYHLTTQNGRTECGLPAPAGYGYTVALGDALALSDRPCGACFTPRQGTYRAQENGQDRDGRSGG